jgi:hypothetical protein
MEAKQRKDSGCTDVSLTFLGACSFSPGQPPLRIWGRARVRGVVPFRIPDLLLALLLSLALEVGTSPLLTAKTGWKDFGKSASILV